MTPLIIDSFAGGGGTSEGIRAALGRDPDYALNHDRLALAMHRINHPGTHHIAEDVWDVDAVGLCAGRPVGLLWMSPDCKHFSKAKGGKPREKAIRGLAWVGVRWVKSLPKAQRPRVVILENVEEFADWGPLLEDGRPCPVQRGSTFAQYLAAWRALGGVTDHRELRACDYGAPTIRKRLFLIIRFDGRPVVWPEPTHGAPTSEGVLSGRLKPWRTAAEIIDWSLPCPSIFESSAEIKARYGIRANRPLAEATMARIAKGTWRYVITATKPFLVSVNHGDSRGRREYPLDEPANTMTASRGEALVTPFVTYGQQGGANREAADPLHTITASSKDQNAIVAPFVTKFNTGSIGRGMDEPLNTVTSHASETHGGGASPLGIVAPHLMKMRNAQKPFNGADEPTHTLTAGGAGLALVSPFLAPRYQEKPGDAPRTRSVEEPAATIVGGGNVPGHLIGACLVPRYGERPGQDPRARSIEEPAPVIVPTGNEGSLAAVHLTRQFGASVGSGADEPVGTITAGGAGKAGVVAAFLAQHNGGMVGHDLQKPISTVTSGGRYGVSQQGVVAAFLAQHNTDRGEAIKPGSDVREPVRTVTASGGQQTLVAAHLTHAYTSNTRGGEGDPTKPLKTVMAGGNHAAAVYAFLSKYYGEGLPSQAADEPLHTVTAKPRHGVVTVQVEGQPYAIVDIGMRMLTPRERFSAQGFRTDYVIDRGELEDGTIVPLTLEQQGRMCGNSVCPQMSEALVRANYRDVRRPDRRQAPSPMSLFAVDAVA